MADPWHHAVSSSRKWGGKAEDYYAVHAWFDESKKIICDYRHRALRHHAEGIAMCVQIFGPIVTISTGRQVPTRWIGEQHVLEDFGFIPSFADWVRSIKHTPWMGRVPKLDVAGADPRAKQEAQSGAVWVDWPVAPKEEVTPKEAVTLKGNSQ